MVTNILLWLLQKINRYKDRCLSQRLFEIAELYNVGKNISTIETLFDDDSTREKYTIMEKIEVMADDGRNNDDEFWVQLDSFLEWGKTYKITITEVSK